jgi:signal transduction histidine kinase
MRRDSIARSTPFRLALGFGAMFFVAFLVTGVMAFLLMRWQMYQRHDDQISETYSSIAGAYKDDLDDFLDAVRSNIAASRRHYLVLLVTAQNGQVLAGNMHPIKLPDGWSTVSGALLGMDPDLEYRLLAGHVRDVQFIVGQSYQDIDDLEAMALAGFAWTSLVVGLLALVGGVLVGLRARRRFGAVSETMGRVAHGELAARIPLLGRGDDIDLLSADINDALERLEMSMEGLREVSNNIAHDLKTPLNRLRITIEEAIRKAERGTAVTEDLYAAVGEMERVNHTFDALLRIAQIEAGVRKERFKELDLNEVLATLADLYEGLADDNGKSISLSPGQDTCRVRGDRELLLQMYANLIENAIRHSGQGKRINLSSSFRSGRAIAIVEDDGPGIPADEHQHVFRRLYRLERSRTTAGNGLGLSLVRAVAELHGATVTLEDAEPGLRVRTEFPAA